MPLQRREPPMDDTRDTGIGKLYVQPDPDGFRKYVREHKSMALVDKRMSEKEAVERFVSDGDYVSFELYGFVRCSMSVCREMVRQRKKGLHVHGMGIMENELLIATGCVDGVDISYLGHEVYGISRIFRRAVEKDGLELQEWSNGGLAWRVKAAAMGLPYLPIRSMLGTDTAKYSGMKVVNCPFTGMRLGAVPALVSDVGVIHVHRCDKHGNAQIDGITGYAFDLARSSKKLIISAEEIVPTERIQEEPDKTIIPYYLVDAVIEAPFGSHPGDMAYQYWRDEDHLGMYKEMSNTPEGTAGYVAKYVDGVKDHAEYMELVGGESVKQKLREESRGR